MNARHARSARSPSVLAGSCWLLAAGGPQFRRVFGLLLLGRPKLLARFRELHRDALHVRRKSVERRTQAHVLAQPLVRAVLAQPGHGILETVLLIVDLLAEQL